MGTLYLLMKISSRFHFDSLKLNVRSVVMPCARIFHHLQPSLDADHAGPLMVVCVNAPMLRF